MTSTKKDIEQSYGFSNEFFQLWLDERMHYTSAVYESDTDTLEQAQVNKSKLLYDYAELSSEKTVVDIGCGWGANLEYISKRGIKEAHGITLSNAQAEECESRKLNRVKIFCQDYQDFKPPFLYDGLVSIEMIDHVVSPAQANQGLAVDLYRKYFTRLAQWVKPGGLFACQAILRNRVPRTRQDLADLQFSADIIFPGGINPRLEELAMAVNPSWEIIQLRTNRIDYKKTTAEWLRRFHLNEKTIRSKWGDKVFVDYDRYLGACQRAFTNHWSSGVQMKLRRID
jgi:cyclopropane-fatty-acyl-phospholipid synthase